MNLRKKIMACVLLQLNFPLPHTSQYALSWTTPPPSPSVRTLWMTPKCLKRKNNDVMTLRFLITSLVTQNIDQSFCSFLGKYVTSSSNHTKDFLNGPMVDI